MKKIYLIFIVIIIILCKVNNSEIDSSNLIRLRVIPNSNSVIDQKMKYKVKEYLENNLVKEMSKINNKEKAKEIIIENIPDIKENINKIFNSNNYDMKYEVNYGYNYFPPKDKYDEGYYESLVISIGDFKGDNWWCILFPNKCLVNLNENRKYKFWFKEKINNIFNK